MVFEIDNIKYYTIKGWEHRYAISEDGIFVTFIKDANCNPAIKRFRKPSKIPTISFREKLLGELRIEHHLKNTTAFDAFNPGVREKHNKCVKFKDGNTANLKKSNLILSDKNISYGGNIELSEKDIKNIKKLRSKGITWDNIFKKLNFDFTKQTMVNHYNNATKTEGTLQS